MRGSFPLNGTYFQVNEVSLPASLSTVLPLMHMKHRSFWIVILASSSFNLASPIVQVFADHETSITPIRVPRSHLWKLRRRFVFFGTSVPAVFKGGMKEDLVVLSKLLLRFRIVRHHYVTAIHRTAAGLTTEEIRAVFWQGWCTITARSSTMHHANNHHERLYVAQ